MWALLLKMIKDQYFFNNAVIFQIAVLLVYFKIVEEDSHGN